MKKGKKKGKDVDLYSAFHAPGTPNAHVTETRPPDRHLGHRRNHNSSAVVYFKIPSSNLAFAQTLATRSNVGMKYNMTFDKIQDGGLTEVYTL